MTTIDSSFMKLARPQIEAALSDLAQRLGVQFELTGGRYAGDYGHYKLNISPIGEGGRPQTKEADAFKKLARLYGLDAEDLYRQFSSSGERFEIVGLNTKAAKYPILGKRLRDGHQFKFPATSVVLALKMERQGGGSKRSAIEGLLAESE